MRVRDLSSERTGSSRDKRGLPYLLFLSCLYCFIHLSPTTTFLLSFYHRPLRNFWEFLLNRSCQILARQCWMDLGVSRVTLLHLGLSSSSLIRPTIEGRSNLSRHKTVVPLYADFLSIGMQIEKIAFGGEIHRCYYRGRPCRWMVQRQYRPP
jgi:hypothetical protein